MTTDSDRAAIEVMAEGMKSTTNVWLNGGGDIPWEVCRWDRTDTEAVTLGTYDTESEAVAARDRLILEFRATAALSALRAAGWWVTPPVDPGSQKRWIIDVSLRPGMPREEALEWMSKIADLIYETPGEWIATVGMQEHPYTPPPPPEPRDD